MFPLDIDRLILHVIFFPLLLALSIMTKYEEYTDYHLSAKVFVIEAEYGGRKYVISDGYRGQFFWHISGETCTDWDAYYVFEGGKIAPGESAMCKIVVSTNLLKYSGGQFPEGAQFGIREGSRFIALGTIKSSNFPSAYQR